MGSVTALEVWIVQINKNPNRTCLQIFTLWHSKADLFQSIDLHHTLNLQHTPLSEPNHRSILLTEEEPGQLPWSYYHKFDKSKNQNLPKGHTPSIHAINKQSTPQDQNEKLMHTLIPSIKHGTKNKTWEINKIK